VVENNYEKYLLHPLDNYTVKYKIHRVAGTHVAGTRHNEETAMTTGISRELQMELEWLMEDCELTAAEALERMVQDCEDKDHPSSDFRNELRSIGIRFGVYAPVSHEEAASTWCNRKWWTFKRNGVKYEFRSWDNLQNIASLAGIS